MPNDSYENVIRHCFTESA